MTTGAAASRGSAVAVRAAWVCPIDRAPIRGGWVAIADGRIAALGGPSDPMPPGIDRVDDLGRAAVLPGLVNAHTHFELAWLRDRVPPAHSFTGWVAQLFTARGASVERSGDDRVVTAARMAAEEARRFGTVLAGDISNSLAAVEAVAAAGLRAMVFHELLGFKETTAQRVLDTRALRDAAGVPPHVHVGLAPHAPYSVSAELFRAIREEVDRGARPITSVHLGESPEEVDMLVHGTGPWPGILRMLGAWRDGWTPPGVGPVEYLDGLGFLDERTLVVHGVQFDDRALAVLAGRGCTLVTCPRSNRWVGVGAPPVARFYASGVAVAVGTDSLASVADLNVFAELADMRWLAPDVPASRLLESATLTGARALGFGDVLGSITPGKDAALIAVEVPPDVEDVEEYLVTAGDGLRVSWVEA